MLKALQKRTKRATLSAALMSSAPAMCIGWLAIRPTTTPDAGEADDDVAREAGVHFKELAVVDQRG
jgi:hypothetical protein